VTVALSGIGGDELFGGYPRYLGMRVAARYAALPVAMRAWIAARAESLSDGSGSRNTLGRLKRFLLDGNRPSMSNISVGRRFNQLDGMDHCWPRDCVRPSPIARRSAISGVFFDQWPSDEPADRAMGVDLQSYLPDDLLRMGDRMSMAHSLELRVPFCDHHLLAFACSLPAATRLQGWKLKGFMRSALRDLLPRSIVSGPKRGFMLPLGRWLREDLREMSRDLLSDEAIRRRGYVNPSYVQWLLAEHQSGRRNFTDQILCAHGVGTVASAGSAACFYPDDGVGAA